MKRVGHGVQGSNRHVSRGFVLLCLILISFQAYLKGKHTCTHSRQPQPHEDRQPQTEQALDSHRPVVHNRSPPLICTPKTERHQRTAPIRHAPIYIYKRISESDTPVSRPVATHATGFGGRSLQHSLARLTWPHTAHALPPER